MKFKCRRTSLWWNEKPCEEAQPMVDKEGNPVVDEDGEIVEWWIELASLEELMAFVEKYVNRVVIVAKCFDDENMPGIEIYDDYRE